MLKPVIYIFANKGLAMSPGKLAAQVAHAAVMGTIDSGEQRQLDWASSTHRTIIVLEARDEAHLRNIYEYLDERHISCARIIDEGVNEIDPHTWTALATGMLEKDNPDIVDALSTFRLYTEVFKVTVEIKR